MWASVVGLAVPAALLCALALQASVEYRRLRAMRAERQERQAAAWQGLEAEPEDDFDPPPTAQEVLALKEERLAALHLGLSDLRLALKNLELLDPSDRQLNELRAAREAAGSLAGTLRGLGLVTIPSGAGRAPNAGPLASGLVGLADLLEPCGCESADDGSPLKRCPEHTADPEGT